MYSIRKIAEMTGFSQDTLRYYEKIGLLDAPRRTAGGARSYDDEDVHRLKAIHCLKNVGLSLRELKEFIAEAHAIGSRSFTPDANDIDVVRRRHEILSTHLQSLTEQRRNIDSVIRQTREKLQWYESLVGQPNVVEAK